MKQLNTNTSDHIPITIDYKLKLDMTNKTIINDNQLRIKEINWLDPFQREYYLATIKNNCSELLNTKRMHEQSSNDAEKTLLATKIFNEMSSLFIQSNIKTIEYKENSSIKEKLGKNRKRQRKNRRGGGSRRGRAGEGGTREGEWSGRGRGITRAV